MKLSDFVLERGGKLYIPDREVEDLNTGCCLIHELYLPHMGDFKFFRYRNSLYAGPNDNHYYMLVRGVPDKNNNVIVHPDTVCISAAAFYTYRWSRGSNRINEIVLGEKVNCNLSGVSYTDVNGIVSNSHEVYYHSVLYGSNPLEMTNYIYFPQVDLSKFKSKDIKIKAVNGFFEKEYKGIETKLDNKYVAYLEKSPHYFYPYFESMPRIFDYLINNILISYADICTLMYDYRSNKEIEDRLIKYREENFKEEYEKEKSTVYSHTDLEDCLDFNEYTFTKDLCNDLPSPFHAVHNINKEYVNALGTKYVLSDLLNIFNRIFIERSHFPILIDYAYSFYADAVRGGKIEIGFIKSEIKDFAHQYYNYRKCKFIPYDTWWIKDNNMYYLDTKWLKLFYDTVKGNPLIDYQTCIQVSPKSDKPFFYNSYYMPVALMKCFVKAVDLTPSFDTFINLIKDLVENKIDVLKIAEHLKSTT